MITFSKSHHNNNDLLNNNCNLKDLNIKHLFTLPIVDHLQMLKKFSFIFSWVPWLSPCPPIFSGRFSGKETTVSPARKFSCRKWVSLYL